MYFQSSIGKIYYTKVGHGPHLSFLHGFCENQSIWLETVNKLKDHYSCLLIDLPGFGKSTLNGSYSLLEVAQMLHELQLELDIEATTVFGHSMGGYIGLELLKNYPNSILGLGLIHSTAIADSSDKKQSRQKVIDFLSNHKASDFLKTFYPQLVSPSNLDEHKDTLWYLVRKTKSESIIEATRAMMNREDHLSTLENTDKPILFLTGDEDAHFSVESIYKQAAICKTAQISLIEKVGHLSLIEAPERCFLAVQEFLAFINLLGPDSEA
jgi:pimeloyl-ACP methyl ester carboxylesterase